MGGVNIVSPPILLLLTIFASHSYLLNAATRRYRTGQPTAITIPQYSNGFNRRNYTPPTFSKIFMETALHLHPTCKTSQL